MEVDTAFVKSKRGILKVAEMGTLLVAFVCFAAASRPKFITATVLEFVITSLLLLLYMFKLNKRLTFFFWPLIDAFNSAFAAVYFIVLSILAVTTYTVTGTLVGGVVGFLSAVLLCVDFYVLFQNITFNKPRSENQSNEKP
ncbi:CKLF-like MARVEL transmembrane domain-containing protein 3 [Gasterosteus aculeatus]|uniref:Chemokine like factor n=2 Tax=Gasterosteus aculeatus TaxID=69293 RepID=A0AAQ4P087_GASAC|nr:CKLF-like MARVEL transmembrane domain-containing protein 3 [Gasterosteus aculeatus aculeatus]